MAMSFCPPLRGFQDALFVLSQAGDSPTLHIFQPFACSRYPLRGLRGFHPLEPPRPLRSARSGATWKTTLVQAPFELWRAVKALRPPWQPRLKGAPRRLGL